MKKRIISMVLLLAMTISLFPIVNVNAATGADIVTEAKKWLGTSYGHSDGSGGPGTSVDCCGLVLQVYKKFGYTLPWSVEGYYSNNTFISGQKDCGIAITNNIPSKNYSNLQQGDLIVFYGHSGSTWHIGIYSGNGYVINAQTSGVKEAYMNDYWYKYAVGVRRILSNGGGVSTKPTNVTIKSSLYNNPINTDVTFTFTYSNADWEAIVITNLDTNKRVDVIDVTGKTTYKYKFTTPGKYKIEIETWNNNTYCTISSCQVNIYNQKPSNVTITADKTYVSTNEAVTFTFTQKDASYWYCDVTKDGVRVHLEEMTYKGGAPYTYTFTNEGTYIVYVRVANNYGWTDVPITITVSNTPEKPALKFMQSHYNSNNAVIFVWDATGATTHYNLYIGKKNTDGEYVSIENVFYAESGLTRTFDPGEYQVVLQSTNSKVSGWPHCNSETYRFAVSNEYIPTDIINYNGHKYLVYDYSITWHEAKAVCEDLGGYLATISSQNEYEIIKEAISKGSKSDYFLGATDEFAEGNWIWVTGEKWQYDDFWRSGEPNNYLEQEHYLVIDDAGNDVASKALEKRGFICEIEEPYTETLYTTYDDSYYICETQFYNVTEDCYVVIAKYDGDTLSGIEIREYTKDKESFVAMGDVDKIKVMLWKNLNTQEELCKAETVDLTK